MPANYPIERRAVMQQSITQAMSRAMNVIGKGNNLAFKRPDWLTTINESHAACLCYMPTFRDIPACDSKVRCVVASREPRAESREPRAESREPRAESREPRAVSLRCCARLADGGCRGRGRWNDRHLVCGRRHEPYTRGGGKDALVAVAPFPGCSQPGHLMLPLCRSAHTGRLSGTIAWAART